jgi:threonine/homoserine/homoserine lactone efflux protein
MIPEIFTVGIAYLLGIMIPGPSINLILNNALTVNRKASFFSVAGTVIGILLQTTTIIISANQITEEALNIIGIFSPCFLIFLGLKVIKKFRKIAIIRNTNMGNSDYFGAFFNALMVEILNPVAFAFFLSILSSFVGSYNNFKSTVYIFEFLIIGIIWFSSVAFIASSQKVLSIFCQYTNKIYIVSGLFFIFFGLYKLLGGLLAVTMTLR